MNRPDIDVIQDNAESSFSYDPSEDGFVRQVWLLCEYARELEAELESERLRLNYYDKLASQLSSMLRNDGFLIPDSPSAKHEVSDLFISELLRNRRMANS